MFTEAESDVWDSTSYQDNFIKTYFQKPVAPVKSSKKESNIKSFSNSVSAKDIKYQNDEIEKNRPSNRNSKSDGILKHGKGKRKKSLDCITQSNHSMDCQNDDKGIKRNADESTTSFDFPTNRKKKRKLRKNKKHLLQKQIAGNSEDSNNQNILNSESLDIYESTKKPIENDETRTSSSKQDNSQSTFHKKLQAAKFRYLNEMLYTNTGKNAKKYFQENDDEFQDYHTGYQLQVSKWPINPVDVIIKELHSMEGVSVIADLGCGEAKIAQEFRDKTVHSFDLMAVNDYVTACDIAQVRLPRECVDVAVFCLSLMGTNWKDYLRESHRILKLDGLLKIAEIESRFDDLDGFINNIKCHGFQLENKDVSCKMFVFLNFKKVKRKFKTNKLQEIILKPCLYKKR